MKQKIVHISTAHKEFDTRIFFKECVSLACHGYDVSFIVQSDKSHIQSGVKIIALKKVQNRLRRMFLLPYEAFRMALKQSADLYHFHDPEFMFWAWVLRIFYRKIVIYDMHENVPCDIRTKSWINPVFRKVLSWFYKVFERVMLNKMPMILAEHSYDDYYRWVKQKVVVLNLPLLDQFPYCEKSDSDLKKHEPLTLGYIGSLTQSRCGDKVVEMMKDLSGQHNVKLVCIGNIDPKYEEYLAKNVLASKYELHGYMPISQAVRIVCKCDVGFAFVADEENLTGSYPTKMFEYMAMGIPVVVSDFPLYAQVINECKCGLLVDSRNSRNLSQAIIWMLEHRDTLIQMGENGRKSVEKRFNWTTEEKKLLSFYKKLLSES